MHKALAGMLLISAAMAASQHASIATRVAGGDYPLNLIEVAERYLVSTNNGYGKHYLQAYDETRREVTAKLELPSLWFGLAYEPAAKRLVASDGQNGVYVVPFDSGRFGNPKSVQVTGCKLTAGLLLPDRDTALVACNQSHEVVRFNLDSGAILGRLRVGEFPLALHLLPGNRMAVSNWGQSSISIIDLAELKKITEITVGSHPNQMITIPAANALAVSCSDSDSVSLISLETLREMRRIDLRPPGGTLAGVQPGALAYSRGKLLVALGAVNGVAVLRVDQEKDLEIEFEGVIPVGAFPTALSYSGQAKTLFVANGRNLVTGPNALVRSGGQPFQYIGEILGGGIEALSDTEFDKQRGRLQSLAAHIYGNRQKIHALPERKPPVKYVFYVIKENRTYDQVLGDMPEGNGSADLVLFGEKGTPNQHALARDYILFDNFFVNGDVCADGHLWSTAGTSTEYVNKVWPLEYSKRATGTLHGPYDVSTPNR